MVTSHDRPRLFDALDRFERCLGTPIVPGEVESWLDGLRSAFEQATIEFVRRLRDHGGRLDRMTRQAPGLFGRRRNLERADVDNVTRCDRFLIALNELTRISGEVGSDERRLEAAVGDVLHAGFEFVVEVRRQEVAIDTWMGEAFNRDRGEGD